MNSIQLNVCQQVLVFIYGYFLLAPVQPCARNESYTSYYLLEIEERHLEEVKGSLDDDDLNLGYAGHIIADIHLFRKFNTTQELFNDYIVENIHKKSRRHVKRIEYQSLQRLLPEEIVHKPRYFKHTRKRRQSSLFKKERRDSLHFLGVIKAWEQNYTGQNIRILIVDNGVDDSHPDLEKNFDKSMCFDATSLRQSCKPYIDYFENEVIHHGTRCAGLIAGVKANDMCGDGVAYHAKIGAFRLFNIHGEAFDANIGRGLSYKRDEVDIYSCSFGFQSDVYRSLGIAAQEAFTEGYEQGRKGKGSIYVFPSGNSGSDAHCNNNGYARSIYTITIGSVGFDGKKANYTEFCPCVLATAFGEGGDDFRSRLITTNSVIPGHLNCTWKFSGSSVSAALASGVIALALEANNNLTSRDIQHLLVRTSDTNGTLLKADWRTNGAGHRINDWFGFGLINASEMVWRAKTWKPVDALQICTVTNVVISEPKLLRDSSIMVAIQIKADGCKKSVKKVLKIEHVEVIVNFKTEFPYQLNIVLTSPMNTSSILMRGKGNESITETKETATSWTLMSVQFWDENPLGIWHMMMEMDRAYSRGGLNVSSLRLILYGTSEKDSQPENENDYKEFIFFIEHIPMFMTASISVVVAIVVGIVILFLWSRRFFINSVEVQCHTSKETDVSTINLEKEEDSLFHLHQEKKSVLNSQTNGVQEDETIPLVQPSLEPE